jgi:hypothetical protein
MADVFEIRKRVVALHVQAAVVTHVTGAWYGFGVRLPGLVVRGKNAGNVVSSDLAWELVCQQTHPRRPGSGAAGGEVEVVVERGMGVRVVVRGNAVVGCERVQVRHVGGVADHFFVALVLFHDNKHVLKAGDGRWIRIHRADRAPGGARH